MARIAHDRTFVETEGMTGLARASRTQWRLRGFCVMVPAMVAACGGLAGVGRVAASEPIGRRIAVESDQAGGQDRAGRGERSFWASMSTESR